MPPMKTPKRTQEDCENRFRLICKLGGGGGAGGRVGGRGGGALGGQNAGLHLVVSNQRGIHCVRKTFKKNDVNGGYAQREIDTLTHLYKGPSIIMYEDHFLSLAGSRGALFTRFCKYGDLLHLIMYYVRHGVYFPEFFVWHVFISITNALAYMSDGDGTIGWKWVVHRDMWPANIFLGDLDINNCPTVILADFGSSVSKEDYDAGRIAQIELRQQPDFAPPRVPSYKVDRRSDIYQLGLVMVAMCRLSFRPQMYRWTFRQKPLGMEYSNTLNLLVSECLQNTSYFRITPRDLQVQLVQHSGRVQERAGRKLHLLKWNIKDGQLGRVPDVLQ